MAPRRVLLQISLAGRMQLRDPRQGNACHYLFSPGVETLPGRCGTSGGDLDRPQEPQVLHVGEAAQPSASAMVALPRPLRLPASPPTRQIYGEAGRAI